MSFVAASSTPKPIEGAGESPSSGEGQACSSQSPGEGNMYAPDQWKQPESKFKALFWEWGGDSRGAG